ncbi:MAG: transporter substrate-binding domain-containing protein [Chloroflexi bacterium]|nr:transporter substrate-binding domain-containing protein [Chloroflexota bacterium]
MAWHATRKRVEFAMWKGVRDWTGSGVCENLLKVLVPGVLLVWLAACGVGVRSVERVDRAESEARSGTGVDRGGACTADGRVLNAGFYAYFAPVSYSADEDPNAAGFNTHRGYEADLLSALEAMAGAGLAFSRRGIAHWDGIWLLSAGPEYDIIGGGITILDSRTRDAAGRQAGVFSNGHVAFRQSLLVRAPDAERLASHADLTGDVRVGVLAGTTGEFRLLELTGLVDANGVLAAGARVETPQGTVVADGTPDYVITAAGATENLIGRQHLYPPDETMPQVVYLGDELGEVELIAALRAGEIDALARGEIGNRDTAHTADGALVVTALDADVEHGGFTLAVEDAPLAACLDEKINWLTDNRRIGYAEWVSDPLVFMRRAQMWNEGAR